MLLASNRSIASQKKKNMQHQMRGPPPPPGARAALADACGSGVCPVTGHAWVRSSTTLVAWPVAPGARGSPAVRGLPSAATDDEFDDGDGEVVLLVSAVFFFSVLTGMSKESLSLIQRR